MKIGEFRDYYEYKVVQHETTCAHGRGPYFTDVEIEHIARWMAAHSKSVEGLKGVCHGARGGLEVDEFKKHLPNAEVFGTDLFPFAGKSFHCRGSSDVVEWDFNCEKSEWKHIFDFVYSNSLDHSTDPMKTLSTWLDQLKEDGHIFLQWTVAHRNLNRGDCMGAELHEYIAMGNTTGRVKDLIYSNAFHAKPKKTDLRRRGWEAIVLVIGPSKNRTKGEMRWLKKSL
jgi:SAM-dependent methyltransferase